MPCPCAHSKCRSEDQDNGKDPEQSKASVTPRSFGQLRSQQENNEHRLIVCLGLVDSLPSEGCRILNAMSSNRYLGDRPHVHEHGSTSL